jgi:signal transduction histidine kinase
MRRPLEEVLNRLDPSARVIHRAWRKLLAGLNVSRTARSGLETLDLVASYRHLSGGAPGNAAQGDLRYRLAVERDASVLMRCGAGEDAALSAIALHLEACLAYSRRPAETRALVRLSSTTQRLMADHYRERRMADFRNVEDNERQRLSRDLHDEVGADLVVLKLYVEMIALELAKGRSTRVEPKVREALVLIGHSIESVRRLTLDLGPAYLDALGFLPALRGVVRQFGIRTGIQCELREKAPPASMPAKLETAVYRVLLGALSNVAKHAKARRVTVTLSAVGRSLVMVVVDDGTGFDLSAQSPARTFGLIAMRERVRGQRGRFQIESWMTQRRGHVSGTRIEIRVPIPKAVAP